MKLNIQIKSWVIASVIFEKEVEADNEKMGLRIALELAVKAGADLTGADLTGADLYGAKLDGAKLDVAKLYGADLTVADLTGAKLDGAKLTGAKLDVADLTGADLYGADLTGADLTGADLTGAKLDVADLTGAKLTGAKLDVADLYGADLTVADLTGAKLDGAKLTGAKLVGERPIFQIGPIGSRCAYFVAYLTDKGIRLRAGCFFGTVEYFRAQLENEHGDNIHAQEYSAALDLIQKHAELWTPKQEEAAEEPVEVANG